MASVPQNQGCGICFGNLATGIRQAIYTAECSHSFHFGCIKNIGTSFCPVCSAVWSNPFVTHTYSNIISSPHLTRAHLPQHPRLEPEPNQFSDDERLPANADHPKLLHNDYQKVSIRAIPERLAVAASEFLPEFSVLIELKAPSLPDSMRRAAVDLVTVLDISGSMHGSKLMLLKRAVHFVIDNLGPLDRLSIVSFSGNARRILPLRRMTNDGRADAKRAVDSLYANGATNIVAALNKGAKVLEERHQQNPVASIIFLSDGNDTCYHDNLPNPRQNPAYMHLLPVSLCPRNRALEDTAQQKTFPVYTFGFGTDHDPLAMHAIADASGGTFSFIESYEMVQDAFAGCIGGLLSVVTQDLNLTLRPASHGVEIKSIHSGRYASEISNQGSNGILNVGDLYADEEKEFLINLSVPFLPNDDDFEAERKSSLLDIKCSYRDMVSEEIVQIECDLVEIRRPKAVSSQDMLTNLEVDRQRNRLSALLTITEAQQLAETGNLTEAKALLSDGRSNLLATASGLAGDGLCMWLVDEMEETEKRMQTRQLYEKQGRAYALSGISAHAFQRATTRGFKVAGAGAGADSFATNYRAGAGPAEPHMPNSVFEPTAPACRTKSPAFGAYATPNMSNMVRKSQEQRKTEDTSFVQE